METPLSWPYWITYQGSTLCYTFETFYHQIDSRAYDPLCFFGSMASQVISCQIKVRSLPLHFGRCSVSSSELPPVCHHGSTFNPMARQRSRHSRFLWGAWPFGMLFPGESFCPELSMLTTPISSLSPFKLFQLTTTWVVQRVMLKARYILLRTLSHKLSPRYIGLFTITKIINTCCIRLLLRSTMQRVSPTFRISHLCHLASCPLSPYMIKTFTLSLIKFLQINTLRQAQLSDI